MGRKSASDKPSSAKLEKPDYETLAAFRWQLRQFLAFSQTAARAAGLTMRQHQALLSVVGRPGRDAITVGEMADYLLIQHHSAVELTDRLVSLGLVTRDQAIGDKRKVMITLTPRAREMLARMSAVHFEELRRIGPQLMALLTRFGSGLADSETQEIGQMS